MRARIVFSAMMLTLLSRSSVNAQSPAVIERVERELTLKRLQGIWIPDLLVTKEGAESYPLKGRRLYFAGTDFARIEGNRTIAMGSFKAEDGILQLKVSDPTPWDLEAADSKDQVTFAYRVESDLLTLCFSADGKVKAGDLTPGAGRQVVVYKRQPADEPVKRAPGKR